MMRWVLVLSWLVIIVSSTIAQDFERAATAYEQGNYTETIQIYEQALAEGYRSGELYLNLAHAHFAQGNRALATLNYRRAAQYFPRDDEIEQQLVRLRSTNNIIATGNGDWFDTLAAFSSRMTLRELSVLALVLWSAFFSLLSLRRFVNISRAIQSGVLLLIALALLLATICLGSRAYIESQRPSAVLLTSEIPLMSGPDQSYLQIGLLRGGTELQVIAQDDVWLRVRTLDGQQGWLPEDNIVYVDPAREARR